MKHKAKRAASLALGLALALQVGAAASAQGLPTGGYENGAAALNLTQIARYSAGQYNEMCIRDSYIAIPVLVLGFACILYGQFKYNHGIF